jgi:hypothetical protein
MSSPPESGSVSEGSSQSSGITGFATQNNERQNIQTPTCTSDNQAFENSHDVSSQASGRSLQLGSDATLDALEAAKATATYSESESQTPSENNNLDLRFSDEDEAAPVRKRTHRLFSSLQSPEHHVKRSGADFDNTNSSSYNSSSLKKSKKSSWFYDDCDGDTYNDIPSQSKSKRTTSDHRSLQDKKRLSLLKKGLSRKK